MSWWTIIKNKRNIKLPKRRKTKEVPKYAFSRPAIKTKEQIQADQEKLKQKGKRQKKINAYVKNIEGMAKEANDSLMNTERIGESYSRSIEDKREKLKQLEREFGYEDEKVLSLQKEIDERDEEIRHNIAYMLKWRFIDNVNRFVRWQEERKTNEAELDLDEEDKQRIDRANRTV